MQHPSYQTVKLTKGKHASPHRGVCVMELASMLAREPFTDHPSSVSGSIAAFLRMYNDLLDDRRRQDLYAYASRVVGTAGRERTERQRAERLIAWGEEMWQRRSPRWLRRRLMHRVSRPKWNHPESGARYAIKAMGNVTNETHARALGLVDELVDMGAPAFPASIESTTQRPADPIGSSEAGRATNAHLRVGQRQRRQRWPPVSTSSSASI